MKIKNEIIINFPLNKYIQKTVNDLENLYKKAQIIQDKNSKEYEDLEGAFYDLTQELEVFVNGAWRSGQFSEKEGELLLQKYVPFNW